MILDKRITIIESIDDSRLAPFWNLRERTLRGESIFMAEGALVVERLLRSPYGVDSILTTRKETGVERSLELVPDRVFPGIMLRQYIGSHHRGQSKGDKD